MGDKITLRCARCGSEKFAVPSSPQPSDTVTCAKCGASGRYGDIRKQALTAAKKEVERIVKKAFKLR